MIWISIEKLLPHWKNNQNKIVKKISWLKIQDWLLTCDEQDSSFFQSHRYKCILNAFLKFLALNFYHSKLHNNSNSIYVSMTSVLEHSITQPTKCRFLLKKCVLVSLVKNHQNLIFIVKNQFSSFRLIFSVQNLYIWLGEQLTLITFFDNVNFRNSLVF